MLAFGLHNANGNLVISQGNIDAADECISQRRVVSGAPLGRISSTIKHEGKVATVVVRSGRSDLVNDVMSC
jgi:hypothetical protein